MSVSIVTTLSEPVEQTLGFVHYHINLGVDRLFLFFDNPDDPAIEVVERYPEVRSTRCDQAYWSASARGSRHPNVSMRQRDNASVAVKWAREEGLSFISHIDADELIYCVGKLQQILHEHPGNVIRYHLHEAVAEQLNPDHLFSPTLFRRRPPRPHYRLRVRLAGLLGVKECLFAGEYFRGHASSKIVVRTDLQFEALEIHQLKGAVKAREVTSRKLKLLHFDCVGYERWKRKWQLFHEGTRVAHINPARRKQLEAAMEARLKGEDEMERLFRKLYFIKPSERWRLKTLGLLTRIYLPQAMFHRPLPQGA